MYLYCIVIIFLFYLYLYFIVFVFYCICIVRITTDSADFSTASSEASTDVTSHVLKVRHRLVTARTILKKSLCESTPAVINCLSNTTRKSPGEQGTDELKETENITYQGSKENEKDGSGNKEKEEEEKDEEEEEEEDDVVLDAALEHLFKFPICEIRLFRGCLLGWLNEVLRS